ncbi:MAG: hypothetical protein HYU88_14245 [Chloroflexi bacterium]|nr:hypothetical protein [Chloroflexota bacterium]
MDHAVARSVAIASRDPGCASKSILIAGVGYGNLRDLSLGPLLVERLRRRAWPEGVVVEDLSFGAVAALHWLQAHAPFDAAVFLAGVPRGRPPGSIHRYEWAPEPVATAELHARVAEGVTGVIDLEALLAVAGAFAALPRRVLVIEVEPRDREWGPALSPGVETAAAEIEALLPGVVEELLA